MNLGSNINRRHMTKGQRAMAVAMIYPNSGRGQTPNNLGFAAEYVRQARTVLKHTPSLTSNVLSGKAALNDAYPKYDSRFAFLFWGFPK